MFYSLKSPFMCRKYGTSSTVEKVKKIYKKYQILLQ
jgi:hypothetical protein